MPGVNEAQRGELVEGRVVEGDPRGLVPVLQAHGRVEPGGPGAQIGR
jgi:hypothetical protein